MLCGLYGSQYGDLHPTTDASYILAIFYIPGAVLTVANALGSFTEYQVPPRQESRRRDLPVVLMRMMRVAIDVPFHESTRNRGEALADARLLGLVLSSQMNKAAEKRRREILQREFVYEELFEMVGQSASPVEKTGGQDDREPLGADDGRHVVCVCACVRTRTTTVRSTGTSSPSTCSSCGASSRTTSSTPSPSDSP
jgi:hypothetical protein